MSRKAPGTGRADGGVRLQKLIAERGIASRRRAEDLIREGRVFVNGRPATLGQRVVGGRDKIEIDGARIPADPDKRYFILNKPAGYITTTRDPEGRPKVTDLIPAGERLYPVGRLDAETEGLLILTNDGDLTHRLTHPSFEVAKRYLAEIEGNPAPETIRRLRDGVRISSGRKAKADRVRVTTVRRGRHPRALIEMAVHEGRKHVVRRMLEEVGHPVVRLVRTEVAGLRLGRMKPAAFRELTPSEVAALYRLVGL